MKRFTFSVVIAAVLGVAAYTVAGAQGGQGGGRGPGGPGFGRGGAAVLRGVDLTDAQREQIKAIHETERDGQTGPPADAALNRQLQAELYADAPDAQKIADLQQQLAAAQSARLAKRIAIEQKIAQILTAEQRAQVRERLASAPDDRGPRRGGRGAFLAPR